MASTQLQTVTEALTITHGRVLCLASARLYAIVNDGTNLVYQYSDDDGVTWSSETTIAAGARLASAVYDSVNSRLNICYAGGNSGAFALKFRAITSNVTSGAPGALTTEVDIDAGGANVGVQYPYMIHSATGSNPRYWIIAKKWTSASAWETRVWYVNVTTATAADSAGNWTTTNFTNLGANGADGSSHKMGVGFHWTVGGAEKVTFVFERDDPLSFEAVTFDPTAATPTPGTVTSSLFATGDGGLDANVNGAMFCGTAKADYAVFGRYDRATNTWGFWKSTNGTTWTQPSGWSALTMGRCQITKSSGDFYLLHGSSYGAIATTTQGLLYRKITASTDTMGGVTAFSDTSGNGVAVPHDTGTSKLYGLYRGSTASPYTVRSDTVSIGGAADTTAPGQATVTATRAGDTAVDVAITMPADIDVAEYEVRFLTGSTYPATTRADGTVAVSPTATSANAVVTFNHTGLTSGTRYAYRVFVKDTAGNWNTGATATAVAASAPSFLGRYTSAGVAIPDATTQGGNNVIVEYQLASGNFETGGANAHFGFRIGYNNATPPTQNTYELVSTGSGQTVFRYEDPAASGTWVSIGTSGLASTYWGRKLRVYTDTTQSSQFGSLQVRQ